MTPSSVLTACVGISAYPPHSLLPGEDPLRFLAASASDVSNVFKFSWPSGANSAHLLLTDSQATWSSIRSSVAGAPGSYDLFILYLGGHGRGLGRPFEFVFFPEGDKAAVRSQEIDGLLLTPNARHRLLLLDACFAG